jgi:hypothetical protein
MRWIRNHLESGWPITVIFTAGLIGYLMYVNYKQETLTRIYRTRNSIETIRAELQNSQKFVDAFIAARAKISTYLPMFFSVDEPQALIDDMKNKAANREVRLADIQLDIPKFVEVRKSADHVSIVPFKASFHGDFLCLGKFLVDLERTPYIQTISEMNLTIQDGYGNKLLMTIKGALRFFDNDLIKGSVADAT